MKELLEVLIRADKAEDKLNAHLSRLYHDNEQQETYSKNSLLAQALCSFEVMDILFKGDHEVNKAGNKTWETIWYDTSISDNEKVFLLLELWEKIS